MPESASSSNPVPRVTVVVGYHNRRPVLERTIRSILEQEFSDLELMLFDDASTDGTAEELARLEAEFCDPRFKVCIHETNLGFTAGLVQAIEGSASEYIAIQGSGDVSHPSRILRQVALLDSRPELSAVGCWYRVVEPSTGRSRVQNPSANHADLESMLKSNVFSHGEVTMRRRAYEDAGGYRTEFPVAQDRDLWLRLIQCGPFATVPEVLYDRYASPEGVSVRPQKMVSQAWYSALACQLAQMPPGESAVALERVRASGPEAAVPLDAPGLQRRLTWIVRAAGLNGSPAEAIAIASSLICSRRRRYGLVALVSIYNSWFGGPLRLMMALKRRLR